MEDLTWTDDEARAGKRIHVKDFPHGHGDALYRAHGLHRNQAISQNDSCASPNLIVS